MTYIDSMIHVPWDTIGNLLTQLFDASTFDNPKYAKNEKLGYSNWKTPPTINVWKKTRGCYSFPRGLEHLVDPSTERYTSWHTSEYFDTGEVPLRGYQDKAVSAVVKNKTGIVCMPCGAGKTVTAISAIRATGAKALILVHTKDLLSQWIESILRVLGVHPGVVGGGTNKPGECITVAMVQTLSRWNDGAIEELSKQYGMLIVDECHHAPASTFERVANLCHCDRRIGLTATPYRNDGLTGMLHAVMGPTIFEVKSDDLFRLGHLARPAVRVVETGREYSGMVVKFGELQFDYNAVLEEITSDPVRLKIVGDIVRDEVERGHSVLVLSNRKQYAEEVRVASRVGSSVTITSDTPQKRREKLLSEAKAGRIELVCATQLADEGLDWPTLDRIVLALPSRAKTQAVQRLGRLARPGSSVQPVIIDIVDDQEQLKYQWYSRRRAYKEVLGADIFESKNPCSRSQVGQLSLDTPPE